MNYKSLGDIVTVKGGKRLPKGCTLQEEKNSHPYIRVRDMGTRYIPRAGLEYVPDDVFPKISRYIVNTNDVIISIVGTIGLVSIIDEYFDDASQTENCAKLSGLDQVDALFLYYFLRSKEGQAEIKMGTVGAVQAKLPLYNIEKINVYWPEKVTREKIVEQLSSLDEKLELNTQTNQTLEQIAQALFNSWFVDFDPVKAKMETLAAGGSPADAELAAMSAISAKTVDELNSLKESNPEAFTKLQETAALFPSAMQDSELGLIPEGWDVLSLQESFKVVMGQSPKGDTYNNVGEGTLFYQGRAEFGWRFPTPRLYTSDPKRLARKGDVLMSVRAPVGDLNIAMNDCCIGRGLCSLLHNSGSTSFTYYLLKNLQKKLDSFNGEGTVFGSINQKDLKATRYVSASKSIIDSFIELIGRNDQIIEVLTLESLTLVELRDSLLLNLLAGKV